MNKKYWLLLLPLIVLGFLLHSWFWLLPPEELLEEDMYYIWLEGKRIINGENPYARVLASDMRVNDKYATYFPVAYLFSALIQKFGFTGFHEWIYIWRPVSLLFHIGIVALVLNFFWKRGLSILGFAVAAIILLGRWSIVIVEIHQLEFSAIFFLLLSLLLLKQKPKLSVLLFSISLGIKHIAIFLLPLYLIYLWKNGDKNQRFKNLLSGFFIMSSIPLLTSLPFIFWNAEGFVKSILFSATRLGEAHVDAASVDVVLAREYPSLVGLKAKIPMLLVMGLIYFSFWKERVGIFLCCALTMMVFVYFNSVLYLQYMMWYVSLIPFALVELRPLHQPNHR